MARPGLKPPPTHAVVVRGGEAPLSPEIPAYRSSFLPPPPPSDPEALLSEKQTLRALPRPSPPPADLTPIPPSVTSVSMPPPSAPVAFDSLRPVMESLPPPSDAPMVSSGSGALPFAVPRMRSRWSIVVAAAVGLLFGVVSVAMTVGVRQPAATVAAAPPVVIVQPAAAPAEAKAAVPPAASAEPATPASAKLRATDARAPRIPQPAPKQSIF